MELELDSDPEVLDSDDEPTEDDEMLLPAELRASPMMEADEPDELAAAKMGLTAAVKDGC